MFQFVNQSSHFLYQLPIEILIPFIIIRYNVFIQSFISFSARWTEHESPITAQHFIERAELPTNVWHVIIQIQLSLGACTLTQQSVIK